MTAVIHHGAPGSYKTFALVQRVLIPSLQEGRLVITNVRGFNDIERIKSVLGVDIPATAQIMYLEPDTTGYETLARFFHWAPAGALIVMDEGQRVYPMRDRRFDHLDQADNIPIFDQAGQPLINTETNQYVCRPATLEIAIDQHRHFNWDIYISTTNVAKIHSEIRKAVEWGYRHRDNSGLLPWYKNTWTEFRHDAEQNGKSVSHYSGTPKRYKADTRIFECYQSTATGAAKVSNENISIFRDPKLQLLSGVILIALVFVGYNLHQAYQRVTATHQAAADVRAAKTPVVDSAAAAVSVRDDHRVSVHQAAPASSRVVNPFEGLTIYFVGSINTVDLFEVELPDGRLLPTNTIDLRNFGYVIKRRFGAFVAFDLHGTTVYAFTKPPAPIVERLATMERSATQLGASIN